MILVTGGSGTLGRPLLAQLIKAGVPVRALSRKPRTEVGVEWVQGDLAKSVGLEAALEGVDTIIHCASATKTAGSSDVKQTRALVQAAAAAKVGHLIYVSIVGIDRTPMIYYKRKLAVEQVLSDSTVPYTILRATQFHDLLAGMLSVQRRLPVVLVPKNATFQPIATHDVAARLVELAEQPPAGRVADIGGPEVLDIADLASTLLAGSRRKIVRVPVPGKLGKALRAGSLTVPENRYGTQTFAEYLATR